jgi:hypothetical protein
LDNHREDQQAKQKKQHALVMSFEEDKEICHHVPFLSQIGFRALMSGHFFKSSSRGRKRLESKKGKKRKKGKVFALLVIFAFFVFPDF